MENYQLKDMLTKDIIKSYLSRTNKNVYVVTSTKYGNDLPPVLIIAKESEIIKLAEDYVSAGGYEIRERKDIDKLHVTFFDYEGYIEITVGVALHAMIKFEDLDISEREIVKEIYSKCCYGDSFYPVWFVK